MMLIVNGEPKNDDEINAAEAAENLFDESPVFWFEAGKVRWLIACMRYEAQTEWLEMVHDCLVGIPYEIDKFNEKISKFQCYQIDTVEEFNMELPNLILKAKDSLA
jgi:hypothetical protein